ncbi:MAG TPA: bifunctional riboflavin kinase/FAD synthetase [Anaerolineales bacterium]|nr:bifunctional riboflavin kinase/FAD synthetase [Anaerolineales bacterium]
MQHYSSLNEVSLENSWLAIGVFDGVHRGHQQIIRRLTAGAHEHGVPAVVLTFHPHPARIFGRGEIRLLTLPEERADLFASFGVDAVVTHPFDRDFANTTALDFMKLLKQHLSVSHLVLGYDSTVGKNREGNAARLVEIGAELGYSVEVTPALSDESGVISSTEIRKLVATGNVVDAAQLMGHPYSLHGPVSHGDKRGRTINVPTANIEYSPDKLIPANGIYACRAYLDGREYQAAINIGVNPTFTPDKQIPNVEAHLLDFQREIYGEDVKLEFVARLRDELRFDSVDKLLEQIWKDIDETRRILNSG